MAEAKAKKKTTKKPAAKKTPKKTSVKKKSVSKPVVEEKVNKIECVSHEDESQRVEIKHGKENKGVIVTERLQLALISPFRYPINYDQVASQTARYVGFAFVLIGAILTVYNLQTFTGLYASALNGNQSANVASSTCIEYSSAGECVEYEDDEPYVPPQTEFPIEFVVDSNEPLKGIAIIYFHVDEAEEVEAVVFHKDMQQYHVLGDADSVSNNKWKFAWDTTFYDDGEYRLKAIVHNEHGSYDGSDTRYVEVKNQDEPEPEPNPEVISEETEEEDTGTTSTSTEADTNVEAAEETEEEHEETEENEEVEQVESTEESDVITDTGADETEDEEDQENDILITDEIDEIGDVLPEIDFGVHNTHDGIIEVKVGVEDAQFIELYAKSLHSLTEQFVGLLQQRSTGVWYYEWRTSDLPNGEYKFFVRVKNMFGFYESDYEYVNIFNDVTKQHTVEEETYIEELEDKHEAVQEEIKKEERDEVLESNDLKGISAALVHDEVGSVDNEVEPIDEIEEFIEELEEKEIVRDEVKDYLREFKHELDGEMDAFARALRSDDPEKLAEARERMEELRTRILTSVDDIEDSEELVSEINTHLRKVKDTFERKTIRNEEVIKERVGDAVFADSDEDGISDYDEVNIYETDPFVADSDGDGFVDGAEILSGFDPRDARAEVVVTYESPKDTGIVREDILVVEDIVTLQPDEDDDVRDGVKAQAVLSGKALPNSFVTLYIFSTPIVVTVKTDADGTWNYTFDKELEDGQHEVYVGITDNAGRIVAKSNPLTFVKTAEAFSPVDAAPAGNTVTPIEATPSPEPTVISENIVLVVLSILIVALGLVLILLGMHLQARMPKVEAVAAV